MYLHIAYLWRTLTLKLRHLLERRVSVKEEPLEERLADIITDVLEDEYYQNKISLAKKDDYFCKLSKALGLPGLAHRQLTEEERLAKPKSHTFLVRRKD